MTRTALGTDDSGDDDGLAKVLHETMRKYEEDERRRAVLREARKITRDAAKADRPPTPDPRLCPEPQRRRVDREKR